MGAGGALFTARAAMLSIAGHLGPDGPLSRLLQDYAPRPQQQEMAETVGAALAQKGVLICEAGTGTGKTFAYLVPTLLSGAKVIISTGTKSLQEQLFHRDLPLVRRALGSPVRAALLKGRSNYLCPQRLEVAGAGDLPGTQHYAQDLARIEAWAPLTNTGDISELPELSEDAGAWRYATSTTDNCLGQDCPALAGCFVLKARRAAMEADVVVVNHHLFFADMGLRDDGFGELLPGADGVILDEAHQVPEIATQFFGTALSSRQLIELARDCAAAYQQEAGDFSQLPEAVRLFERQTRDLRLALGVASRRVPWGELEGNREVRDGVTGLGRALSKVGEALSAVAERGKALESCHRRCLDLGERLTQVTRESETDYLRWVETREQSFTLHMTPLDIAGIFSGRMSARRCGWIFTSATLAVDGRFEHFAARLGLAERDEGLWESPFDFRHQALCYLPQEMPDPNAAGYTHRVIEVAIPVLQASRGRTFLLFTSHRALREAAQRLAGAVDYPLFVQGDAPRSRLLQQFRETPHAVLLGTSSFWEGVDVRGEALSCVIIDRLPFASPDDPVLQARYAAIREKGGNPFMDYQLPQAVIALKQGAGRLIRDAADRGVLVLCDPRIRTRAYGRVFLDSLPAMPRTRNLREVQKFYDGES
jgi:ATP-dependent DNA helicase DinG